MLDFKVKAISPLVSQVKVNGQLAGFVTWNPSSRRFKAMDSSGSPVAVTNNVSEHMSGEAEFLSAVRQVIMSRDN